MSVLFTVLCWPMWGAIAIGAPAAARWMWERGQR